MAELDSAALVHDIQVRRPFREFDRLPSIELDIAMILARGTPAGAVRKVVRDVAGPLLRDTEVFDQFFDEKFGANDKALAVRLRLNAGERTLEMSEALEVRARVARALEAELSARIRE
jgi:phenylalanyl-tRNA synthetase beta subunit